LTFNVRISPNYIKILILNYNFRVQFDFNGQNALNVGKKHKQCVLEQ